MLRLGVPSVSIPLVDPKPVRPALAAEGQPSITCRQGFELNAHRLHRATFARQEETHSSGTGRPALEENERVCKLIAHQYERSSTVAWQGMVVMLAGALLSLAVSPTATLSAGQQPAPSAGTIAPAGPWSDYVAEAARRFAIPERWIRTVMQVESAGNVHATSPKGARGLMQIMPGTWDDLRVKHDLGNHPYLPRDNILAGAAYLREMLDRFGESGFLAAYHAGPSRYETYLATGLPLPTETVEYVAKVTSLIDGTAHNPSRPRQAASWRTAFRSPIYPHAERTSDVDPLLHARDAVAPVETVFTAVRSTGDRSPVGAHVTDLTGIGPLPIWRSDDVSARPKPAPDGLFVHHSAGSP